MAGYRSLPIGGGSTRRPARRPAHLAQSSHHDPPCRLAASRDRKSTRRNSSHVEISYAVFCLKKKKRPTCPKGPPIHDKATTLVVHRIRFVRGDRRRVGCGVVAHVLTRAFFF